MFLASKIMKQIFQNLESDQIFVEEVLYSQVRSSQVISSMQKAVLSLGAERVLLKFGGAKAVDTG